MQRLAPASMPLGRVEPTHHISRGVGARRVYVGELIDDMGARAIVFDGRLQGMVGGVPSLKWPQQGVLPRAGEVQLVAGPLPSLQLPQEGVLPLVGWVEQVVSSLTPLQLPQQWVLLGGGRVEVVVCTVATLQGPA